MKGILKNSRIPTKRSVSECVDDLSHYMDDLDINIDDLKSRRFCPLHPFPEQVEYEQYSCDEDDEDEDDDDDNSHDGDDDYDYENRDESHDEHDDQDLTEECNNNNKDKKRIVIDSDVKKTSNNKLSEKHDNNLNKNTDRESEDKENGSNKTKKHAYSFENNNIENNKNNIQGDQLKQLFTDQNKKLKGCACYDRYRSDSSDGSIYSETTRPRKKSVHFDDRVYETVYIASRLYDRRAMAKYRFSTRHHPQQNNKQNKKQSKKRTAKLSKSETKQISPIITSKQNTSGDKSSREANGKQSEAQQTNGCRLTKSQRSKQSKKDKLKMKLRRKEESCSSDDQGYGSSVLNLSD